MSIQIPFPYLEVWFGNLPELDIADEGFPAVLYNILASNAVCMPILGILGIHQINQNILEIKLVTKSLF